jgi:branched-chain amino acid transport system substrate-binding protein
MVLPGEPDSYIPTGRRNFMRIVPRDSVEAPADLIAMQSAGCHRIAVGYDATPYGTGMAQLIKLLSLDDRVSVISETALNPTGRGDRAFAATLRPLAPDCFYFAGTIDAGAVQVVKDVNAVLPSTKIFGPSHVCTSAWTNAKLGGVPASIDPLIECTALPLKLTAYRGGTAFATAYTAQFGVAANPYAIYGYEAMSLALDTIHRLGSGGDNRAEVLAALLATKKRSSVLGTYSFDPDGDTSLTYYGLYKVGTNHDPKFVRVINPAR